MTASPHKRTSGQPVRRGLTSRIGLQKGFTMGEIGLHSSNFDPLMSALGQKQTSTRLLHMSALPPKADIRPRDLHVRFVPLGDIEPLALGFRTAAA
jgi:hypothetical protein